MFFLPKTSGGDKGGAISFRNLQGSDDSDEEDVSITYGKTHPKRPSKYSTCWVDPTNVNGHTTMLLLILSQVFFYG